MKCSKDQLSKSNLWKLSVDRVANGVKTTISDNRNIGNEDNHIGDIIAQNRTQKNAAKSWPQKSAASGETETTASLQITTYTLNKMLLSEIKKLTAENEELKNKINDIKKGQRILGRKWKWLYSG